MLPASPSSIRGVPLSIISLAAFGVKGAASVAVSIFLANKLGASEFALWSAVFSFGIVLSLADLGIGQLLLTSFFEGNFKGRDPEVMLWNAVAAMSMLAAALLFCAPAALRSSPAIADLPGVFPITALIVLRLPLIPFGAMLSAAARFHERKVIEAASYVVGATAVAVATQFGTSLALMLVLMNGAITGGSVLAAARAVSLSPAGLRIRGVASSEVWHLYRGAWPYFVNNLSGLVVYGGFVALSSWALPTDNLAKLAVLHGFVFMQVFQVFDLVFRSNQTRLDDKVVMSRMSTLVFVSAVGYCVLVLGGGPEVLSLVFQRYRFSRPELLTYGAFLFGEIYYALLASNLQMRERYRDILARISVAKVLCFTIVIAYVNALRLAPTLSEYAAALAITSGVTTGWAVVGRRGIERERKQSVSD